MSSYNAGVQKLLEEHSKGALGLLWEDDVRQPRHLQVVVSSLARFMSTSVWVTCDCLMMSSISLHAQKIKT